MEASALLAAFTLAALRRNAVLAGEGTGTSRDAREGWQVPPVASRLLSGGPPRRRQALYLSGGEFQGLEHQGETNSHNGSVVVVIQLVPRRHN